MVDNRKHNLYFYTEKFKNKNLGLSSLIYEQSNSHGVD